MQSNKREIYFSNGCQRERETVREREREKHTPKFSVNKNN